MSTHEAIKFEDQMVDGSWKLGDPAKQVLSLAFRRNGNPA